MTTSVITIVRGRLAHLANLRTGLARQRAHLHEHVVVRMGGPDLRPALRPLPCHTRLVELDDVDPLPLARARNTGARTATGDLLVFLDVDCIPGPGLVGAYRAVADGDGLWTGPVWYLPPQRLGAPLDFDRLRELGSRHPAQPVAAPGEQVPLAPELFWSLSFAVRRRCFARLGGFDEAYVGYGGEDTDLARTAMAHSVPLAHVADAHAFHQHHPSSSPPVEHLDAIVANSRVFRRKWGCWPMRGWLAAFAERGLITLTDDAIERVA